MNQNAANRILVPIENGLNLIGCGALLLVAILINGDILGRILFNVPVQIQFEMTEIFLMPMLAALPISKVYREGGHLALEVIPKGAFGASEDLVRKFILALSIVFFALVTWESGTFAAHAFARNDVEWGVIDWPLGWAYAAIPVGCGVLVLRLVVDFLFPRERET